MLRNLPSRRLMVGVALAVAALAAAPVGIAGAATKVTKAPKAGAACTKAGTKSGSLVCTKVGKSLKWVAAATPTTAATPATTPATGAPAATGGSSASKGLPPGEYKIGFAALKSGPAAFAGVPLAAGAEMAVKEINDTKFLGNGVTLKMLTEDTGGLPANAIAATNKFIAEKVSGIVCCALSSEAGSVKPIVQKAKTAAIVDSAILAGLNEPPYMYRPVLIPGLPGGAYEGLVKAYVKARKPATAVIGVTADNQGMKDDSAIWKQVLESNGVQVLRSIDTGSADTDFSGPASQIVDLKPDVFVNSMLGGPGTRIIKALRGRGFKGGIISNYGIDDQNNFDIGGDSLGGVLYPIAFFPSSPAGDMAKNFITSYKAQYKEDPSIYPAQGYTAVWMLALGMKASGDGSPDNVAQALAKMTDMDSVYGPLAIKNGQATMKNDWLLVEWTKDGYRRVWSGF